MNCRVGYIGLLVVFALGLQSYNSYTPTPLVEYVEAYTSMKYKKPMANLIYVGTNRQKLYLIKNHQLVRVFDVSTSKYGVGQQTNSEKTPLGLHKISSKIGKTCPIGGILVGSNFSGKMAVIENNAVSTGTDDLTTRAMRLDGLEKGLNMEGNNDTHKREIYIHGTPEEGLIGRPASHGCVRMRNKDVIELFDLVEVNCYVLILEN
ncbi:MAG TPA: L,D-transpeptidase [Flavobacteriales bacterium]|nr:L,D-transpeptidase [Flavobacteriales bacterium]